METDRGKEEIIELTDVVEETPSSAEKGELKERPSAEREKTHENRPSFPPSDPGSFFSGDSSRALKEEMAFLVKNWTAGEGEQILQRMAADFLPRMAHERLSPEVEKIKAELAALRVVGEGLSERVELWLSKEGLEVVEGLSQETVSKIAARDWSKEIERVRAEMENLRSERESLSRKYEEWFSSRGLKVLEEKAQEAVPRIVREALEPEIEKFRTQIDQLRTEAEEWNHRAALWFENEGRQLIESLVREIFPPLAEKVLRQEIEKLKEEARSEEND